MKKHVLIILFAVLLVACSRFPELQEETKQKEISTDEEAKEATAKISQDVQNLTKSLGELDKILES